MKLTPEEQEVVRKVLASKALQYLIGAEEWDLSEEDEETLWVIIRRECEP